MGEGREVQVGKSEEEDGNEGRKCGGNEGREGGKWRERGECGGR